MYINSQTSTYIHNFYLQLFSVLVTDGPGVSPFSVPGVKLLLVL